MTPTPTAPTIDTLRLDPSLNGMLMTAEEFDAARESEPGYRYELIHGVLIVSPPPGGPHRSINDELGYLIRRYQKSHPEGSAVEKTLPENYIIVGDERRTCDRAIWVGLGREPNVDRDVPTIAIEIVSESAQDRRRDYVEKAREYPAAGVKEYWIIDRFARELTVITANAEPKVIPAEQVYESPLLPGFEIRIAELIN